MRAAIDGLFASVEGQALFLTLCITVIMFVATITRAIYLLRRFNQAYNDAVNVMYRVYRARGIGPTRPEDDENLYANLPQSLATELRKLLLDYRGALDELMAKNEFDAEIRATIRQHERYFMVIGMILLACARSGLLTASIGLLIATFGLAMYDTPYELFRAVGWTIALNGFYVAYGGITGQGSPTERSPMSEQQKAEARALVEELLARREVSSLPQQLQPAAPPQS
jgi:hypothetical protein